MEIDYNKIVMKLKAVEPDITSVAIIEKGNDLVYSTEDWDLSAEVGNFVSVWTPIDPWTKKKKVKRQNVFILEKKYSILQCTPERFIATSYRGEKNIVGAKDDERRIISLVNKDGDMKTAYVATAWALKQMSSKELYMSANSKLGKYQVEKQFSEPFSLRGIIVRELKKSFKIRDILEKPDELDLQRRDAEKKQRVYELEKVLHALEITKGDKLVAMIIKAEFTTGYIYDDFHLLRIKNKIINLLKQEFQTDYLDLKITKNL